MSKNVIHRCFSTLNYAFQGQLNVKIDILIKVNEKEAKNECLMRQICHCL